MQNKAPPQGVGQLFSLQNITLTGFQTTTKFCIVIAPMLEHATVATIRRLPGSQHTTFCESWYVLLTMFVLLIYSKRIVDVVNEKHRQQD